MDVSRARAAAGNGTGLSKLCFAIRGTNASADQTQVALYGSADESHPFSALFVSHYVQDCTVATNGSWTRICVPIIDLLPPLEPPGPGPPPSPSPSPSPPAPPSPSCTDTPPSGNSYTCAQQKAWGKCDTKANPWMAGYCCKTCFDCAAGCGTAGGGGGGSQRNTVENGGGDSDKYTIVKIELKANYATGVGSFGLDEVRFS